MTKRGYLTSEEYKAIRILLGFSQQEAAEFHHVQNLRTIRRWEKGDSFVSKLACDKITALIEKINWSIEQAINKAEEYAAKADDFEVTLIVYPDACYKKFVYDIGDLPNSIHKTMIYRLYEELKRRNIKVGIVEFNPQDYFTYCAAHHLQDSHESRSQWAVDYRQSCIS